MQNSTDFKTTAQFADMVGIKAESIHRSLSLNGHYLKIRPIKLPNKRLMWPADEIEKLFKSEEAA
jgi:hypothetical protein